MNILRRAGSLCLLLAIYSTASLAASSAVINPDMQVAAKQITMEDIRDHVRYISSDAFEGRGPSTRGDKKTQEYLRAELESLGMKPGAPGGGWIQDVPLVGITTHGPQTLKLSHGKKQLTLKNHDDFIASTGQQKSSVSIKDAEIIFVGYGVVAPEFNWNDFKDVDVKGKILLVMNHNPAAFAGKTRLYYGRWTYKYEQAAKMGAAGVIIIHTTESASYPWQVVQSSWTGELFELIDEGKLRVNMKGWATEDASRKIVELAGYDLDALRKAAESRDFRPVPLGVKVSLDLKNTINYSQSANVIGMIPGSDPQLAKEAVIYSAHHDHLGMKRDSASGETLIYHGAIDNASGVSGLLAIAKAYSKFNQPLKRSVYFVLTASEEQGLLGSEYFVAHPSVPVSDMAANINIDGIGFYGRTRDLTQFGHGMSSLDDVLQSLASQLGRVVIPDPHPESGSFYRADQLNFARAGVPVIYTFAGLDVIGKPAGWGELQVANYVKNDYHQPSDIFRESYDFSGAAEDAQLEFYLGVNIANTDQRPVLNKGNKFKVAGWK
jgi:Zn-dependent M28 family amino/carboxypeptidase